jgi:hypothetical protein
MSDWHTLAEKKPIHLIFIIENTWNTWIRKHCIFILLEKNWLLLPKTLKVKIFVSKISSHVLQLIVYYPELPWSKKFYYVV